VTTTSTTTTTNNKWQATIIWWLQSAGREHPLPWQQWLTVPGTHSYHRSVSDDRLDQGQSFSDDYIQQVTINWLPPGREGAYRFSLDEQLMMMCQEKFLFYTIFTSWMPLFLGICFWV